MGLPTTFSICLLGNCLTAPPEEKEIFLGEVRDLAKPQSIKDSIVMGKVNKRAEEICLLEQSYIKNQDQTVADLVKEATAKLGEKIEIARFSRFEI